MMLSKPFPALRSALLAGLALACASVTMAANHQDAAADATPIGPVTTASGLVYEELVAGTGASPTVRNAVRVHYHGTLTDGTVFDSSVERNEPLDLPLQRVIACWQEGIPMMREGGKARLTCPAEIAYGQRGVGAIPPGATLIFEVELIKVL